jgi:cytochrome c-type biogenesis protein CcmH
MTPAWLFVLLALALVLLVWGVLFGALRSGRRAQVIEENPEQANAGVYRDQLKELERERDGGALDEAEFQKAREELASRLLQDVEGLTAAPQARAAWYKSTAWALGLALPLMAFGIYAWLGQPAALQPAVLNEGMPAEHITPEKIEKMGRELRARLEKNPDQVEDWLMLGRVERALEHYDAAAQALAAALKLSHDPDVAIERAEILATARRGDFQGEPWQIIQSVLKTDPKHLGALLLAGSASYAESRFKEALGYWEKASALVAADSPDREPLDAALGQVRAKLGLPDPRAQAAAASAIHGRVSLDPSARAKVQPDDTVFIYATAPDARMPLAIVRIKASELPYDFVLDDTKAMNPQVHLSDSPVLVVRARVSRSGQAQAQPDDLSAQLTGVKPGARGLQLVLK